MSVPQRSVVSTEKAPAAIGPYSQAVVCGGVVYCSGQIAINPDSGKFEDGDVKEQMHRSMRNLGAVLEAAGSDWSLVLRATIFVTSMSDFAAVNEVYASFFEGIAPPARACVEVRALPKAASVEVDAIAAHRG